MVLNTTFNNISVFGNFVITLIYILVISFIGGRNLPQVTDKLYEKRYFEYKLCRNNVPVNYDSYHLFIAFIK